MSPATLSRSTSEASRAGLRLQRGDARHRGDGVAQGARDHAAGARAGGAAAAPVPALPCRRDRGRPRYRRSWGLGIVPIVIGDTVATLKLAERLLRSGINAFPILPPGVPEKTSRLRFFINADHSDEQIDQAVSTLVRQMAELGDTSLKALLPSDG